MSIRGFHIIFITIATLLCVSVSLWTFLLSGITSFTGRLSLGGGSALVAVALLIYGVYFYQKIKKLNL